jgi:hypothetical protein
MSQDKFEGYELREDGILMYKCRFYMPNDQELKHMIFSKMHQVPYAGHPGYQKTNVAAKKKYFWLGMKKEVADFIARCLEFQKVKDEHKHPIGLLQTFSIPKWKWEVVTMEFITKFPRNAKQHDFIMVVVDNLTKAAHFIPMNSMHKEKNIVDIYMREIANMHGVPKKIVSNIDSKFTSNFWKDLFKGFQKILNFSTTYRPEIDGKT